MFVTCAQAKKVRIAVARRAIVAELSPAFLCAANQPRNSKIPTSAICEHPTPLT